MGVVESVCCGERPKYEQLKQTQPPILPPQTSAQNSLSIDERIEKLKIQNQQLQSQSQQIKQQFHQTPSYANKSQFKYLTPSPTIPLNQHAPQTIPLLASQPIDISTKPSLVTKLVSNYSAPKETVVEAPKLAPIVIPAAPSLSSVREQLLVKKEEAASAAISRKPEDLEQITAAISSQEAKKERAQATAVLQATVERNRRLSIPSDTSIIATPPVSSQPTGKLGLLRWCQMRLSGYDNISITNFGTSWKNGLAFCALIHAHRPHLIQYEKLDGSQAAQNLKLAFDVAEKHLGISKLLDVEDITDLRIPEERSIMLYVSEFYQKFKNEPGPTSIPTSSTAAAPTTTTTTNAFSSSTSISTPSAKPASSTPTSKTDQSSGKCRKCGKTAYMNERIVYDQAIYHNTCFKCKLCDKPVSLSAVAMINGDLYDKNCFKRIFKQGGYSAFENEATVDTFKQQVENAKPNAEIESDVTPVGGRRGSIQDKAAVFAKTPEQQAEIEKQERETREANNRRIQESLPKIDKQALAQAIQVVSSALEKKQEVEKITSVGIEDVLQEHQGATLNFNNIQEFMKATPQQRTDKYKVLVNFLATRNSSSDQYQHIHTFTCTAADLDDEFATLLANHLRVDTVLKEINLENNHITAIGIQQIAQALQYNKTLTTLKLILNTKASAASESLSEILDVSNPNRNRTLTKLTFDFAMIQHRDRANAGLKRNYEISKGWKTQ